jgi:DNA-binding CsgD family transcriptional regulator
MTGRCLVSKELVYTDRHAAELVALIRAGFNVVWLDDQSPARVPAPRPASNGEATINVRRRIKRRRPNLTTQEFQELLALRKKGMATRTLARRFKMSVSGVRNALYRLEQKGGGE